MERKMYCEDLAKRIEPGSPYRPSNGTEGMMFEEMWCQECGREDYDYETGEGGCDIFTRSLAFKPGDPEYPKEWIHGEDGQPKCTAFAEDVEPGSATMSEKEAAGQGNLFKTEGE